MSITPYRILMRHKEWATNGLYAVLADNLRQIDDPDRMRMLRLLADMQSVDETCRRGLKGCDHGHFALWSVELPFETLARKACALAGWYVGYADSLTEEAGGEAVDLRLPNGASGRMSRGEMLLHVAAQGNYHRGAVGLLLQKNWIEPNPEQMIDFLEWDRAGSGREKSPANDMMGKILSFAG